MLAVASLLVVASSSSSSSSTLISAAASPTARTISNLSPVIRIGSDSESNSVDGDDHADDNRLPAEGQVRQHQRQQHPPPQQAQERIPTQNELTRRHPHLPQHRVRSPKRHVSYSENHPLARHRRKHDAMNGESHGREDDSEKREQYEWDDDLVVSNDAVVGGDASEFHRRRRRRQRREEEGPGSRLGDELAMQSRWQRQQRLEHEGRQSNEGTSYFQKFLQMFRRTADDDSNDSLVEHSGFTSVSLRNSRGRDRDFRRFTSLHGNQGEHADNHHYEQIQEGMVIMTANRGASGADSDNRHQTQHHNDGRDKPSSNVDRVRYWSITGRSLVFGEVYDNNRSTTTEPLAAAETALLSAAPSSTAPSSKAPTVFEATVTVSTWNETGAITANGTVDANILYQEYGYGVQSNYSHYNDSLALNNTDMMTSTLLAGQDFQLLPSQTESLSNSNANPLPDFATNSPLSETNPIDVNSHSGDDSQDPPSLYQPIRLQAILTDDSTSGSQFLTQRQRKILMEEMINPALYAWSRALYVVPVGSGGLDRSGSSSVAEGDNGKGEDGVSDREDGSEKDGMEAGTKEAPATLTIDRSQLYDGESCGPGLDSGLPSVRVPLEHIEDGLVGTDTVIYVSVAFAEGTGSSDRPRTGSNGDDEASSSLDADNMHFVYHGWRSSPLFVEGAVTAFSRGERNKTDDNTDPTTEKNQTSVFPSYPPSSMPSYSPSEEEPMVESRPTCPGTYLASATYCSTDQFDRPVAGILSLCIDNIHTFFYNQDQIQRNIVTIMHEMGHILGFNAQSLAHFRDGDTGEPLTPRDEFGDVPDTNVECTGVSPRVSSEIPLPSTNITKFQSVRGGVRVATVVTPTVRRITRNMFGCQELLGAELESGESQLFDTAIDDEELESPAFLSAGECIGDHWNRRLFRTDLLNPIVDDVPFSLFLSSLTLAYFADSGWYRVNSDRIAPASIWGRNSGCEFVQKKCINPNGLVSASNNPFFCNNFALPPAELPSTSKTKSQSKSTSSTTSNSKLLQESAPNLEEEEEVAVGIHGCDLDATRKAVCSLVEHELELPHEYTYFGKVGAHGQLLGGKDPTLDFCPIFEGYSNGQCNDKNAESVVGVNSLLEVFGEDNSRCVIGHVDRTRTALCLPIACVIQDQSLMIKVDGYWKRCMYAGQIISMWWSPKDYVVCPDPSRMCPTFFCPHDCFKEGGTCDYHSGECLCKLTRDSASANSTSTWFSSYYSSPLLEPCNVHPTSNSIHQVVERMDSELPDLYIANMTLLQDDPKNFDDKVSRMLAELSVGDVVGLVASFMLFVVFTYLFWSQLVRCYKQRVVESSISKVRSRVKSISRLLRDSGLPPRRHDEDGGPRMSSGSQQRRPPGNNPQKDKMVASLLVQMRTEATAAAEQEQQGRLQLGGLTNNTSSENDSSDANKECKTTTAHVQTTVNLSSPSDEEVTLHRSDLPPLPDGGRVIAVIGARIIEEPEQIENDDTRSSATSATHITSQSMSTSEVAGYESPLYQDGGESQNLHQQSRLRLRYGSRTDR